MLQNITEPDADLHDSFLRQLLLPDLLRQGPARDIFPQDAHVPLVSPPSQEAGKPGAVQSIRHLMLPGDARKDPAVVAFGHGQGAVRPAAHQEGLPSSAAGQTLQLVIFRHKLRRIPQAGKRSINGFDPQLRHNGFPLPKAADRTAAEPPDTP